MLLDYHHEKREPKDIKRCMVSLMSLRVRVKVPLLWT